MSLFDATVNVADISAELVNPDDGDPAVEFGIVLAHIVPLMGPQGPQGPQGALVPLGALRFGIKDHEKIVAVRDALNEALEVIKDRSALKDFTIASNMSDVANAAQALQQATGQ